MKLYIKQKVFSWRDKFFVMDEDGRDKYYVESEMFTWGKKLHVMDMDGREVAYIEQKVTLFMPEFHVYQGGRETAVIRRLFTWFRPKYEIDGPGWEVSGSAWLHEYEITRSGQPVVAISKEWMTWGDSYELDIANPADEVLALATAIVIDCVIAQSN